MSDYTSTQSGNRDKEHHLRYLILPYIKQEAVPPSTEYHFLVLLKSLSIINTASTKYTIWSRPRPTFHINKTCDSLQFYYIYLENYYFIMGSYRFNPCIWSQDLVFSWYFCFQWEVRFVDIGAIIDYHCLNCLFMTYWRWCEWDYEWWS